MHAELFDELRHSGFDVLPRQIGENITTGGIDLLGLPTGAKLHIGSSAVVEVMGLRNPCAQLDAFQDGLMAAVLGRDEHGILVRKAGIMGIVLAGGDVRAGDAIRIEMPLGAHAMLERVQPISHQRQAPHSVATTLHQQALLRHAQDRL